MVHTMAEIIRVHWNA